jgi:hypothetical protein
MQKQSYQSEKSFTEESIKITSIELKLDKFANKKCQMMTSWKGDGLKGDHGWLDVRPM